MPKKDLAGERATDFSRSPVARYIQLATLFRNRIAAGEWPVGSRIPNVDELAAAFSVARGTMREALGLLEQEGLLERLRAKGTFVRKSPVEARLHNLALDWEALQTVHDGAAIEMIEHGVVRSLPAADKDKGRAAPRYQMLRRLYVRNSRPYLLARFYIQDELYRRHAAQFRKMPALPTLRRVAADRLGHVRQSLIIGAADIEVASFLNIELNAPVVRVERHAVDHDGVIIYSGEGMYRGDSVYIDMELR